MIFVPITKVKPGMLVDEDIQTKNNFGHMECLLKAGEVLTSHYIQRLIAASIDGVFVNDGVKNKTSLHKTIDAKTKQQVITKLEGIFTECKENSRILDKEDFVEIEVAARSLVEQISAKDKLAVGIVDLQTYDENTYYHCLSVAVVSIAIGSDFGFDQERLTELGMSALLHDIGKINVPVEIITKPARLTDAEYDSVMQHPFLGVQYLNESMNLNEEIYDGVLLHHEKYDGTGYPNKLEGDDIPIFAKIIAIADVYDALTANRPYRIPMSPSEAIEYIMANADSAFDFKVIQAFLRKIEPYPDGCVINLSDGRYGVVTSQSPGNTLRPVIRTIEDNPQILNLAEDMELYHLVISRIDYGVVDPIYDGKDQSLFRKD